MGGGTQGKTNLKEPVYGTEYAEDRVPQGWLAEWQRAACGALHLPKLNPFIPADIDMLPVISKFYLCYHLRIELD